MSTTAPPPLGAGLLRDLRIALVVLVLLLVGLGVSVDDELQVSLSGEDAPPLPGAGGLLLLTAGTLTLTFRRRAPVPVFAVSVTASLAYLALGYRPEPLPLGVLVALYTLAVAWRPLVSGVAAVVYLGSLLVGMLAGVTPVEDDQYYTNLVSVVAAVTVGYGVALDRARTSLAEQRADQRAREESSRTRAAVRQEQARIAREVHDIVAHDVSVIVAQAAAARRVQATQPEAAGTALASIEAVGRDALDGLRRMLDLLRTERAPSPRAPQPGLDRLPWLVAQVEQAGLPVDLVVLGEARSLPATLELNAFRIVQEALTNTLKHAGPTRAVVVLDYRDESLEIEVRDGGQGGGRTSSTGYGLVSMRQRVAMLGGDLETGPAGDAGYRVAASIPVGAGAT